MLNDFYKILEVKDGQNENEFSADIELNAAHPIYQGHFPEVPVAPGVCLTQIIQDFVASRTRQDLMMLSADNIKFLIPINPSQVTQFTVRFNCSKQEKEYSCTASFEEGGKTYLKFKGKFLSV